MDADDDELFGYSDSPRDLDDDAIADHRALSWRQLRCRESHEHWWETLWEDVCAMRARYRLPVRTHWWEDEIQVEALAALAAWVSRYDSGDWEDPPGKLSLLFELERVETLLRDGNDPFQPHRDRPEFIRHLGLLGATDPAW